MPNLDEALLYQSTELSLEFPHETFIFVSVTDEYLYFPFHEHLLNFILILEKLTLKVISSVLVLLSIGQFNHIINMNPQHFQGDSKVADPRQGLIRVRGEAPNLASDVGNVMQIQIGRASCRERV